MNCCLQHLYLPWFYTATSQSINVLIPRPHMFGESRTVHFCHSLVNIHFDGDIKAVTIQWLIEVAGSSFLGFGPDTHVKCKCSLWCPQKVQSFSKFQHGDLHKEKACCLKRWHYWHQMAWVIEFLMLGLLSVDSQGFHFLPVATLDPPVGGGHPPPTPFPQGMLKACCMFPPPWLSSRHLLLQNKMKPDSTIIVVAFRWFCWVSAEDSLAVNPCEPSTSGPLSARCRRHAR